MLDNFKGIFKKGDEKKEEEETAANAGDTAKERLHMVLLQDRANVSADFVDMMKDEIIDVIKKYIDIDENEMELKLSKRMNEDGTSAGPMLSANIPIVGIKNSEIVKMEKEKNIEKD